MTGTDHPTRRARGGLPLAALVAVVVLTAIGGGLARLEVDTGLDSMLPASDPVAAALEQKDDEFGGDAVVVILESDEPRSFFTVQDQLMALIGLEGELAGLADVAAVYGPGTILNQTAGAAQDMLSQIMGRRDGLRQTAIAQAQRRGLSPAAARAAGERVVKVFDRRYGALLVEGMGAGLPTLRNPRFVETVLFDENLAPRPEWKFVVPAPDKVALLVRPRSDLSQDAAARLTTAVEDAVADSDVETSRVTVTGVPTITAALSERARSEAPRLGLIGLAAVGLVFLLVPWTSRRRSRLRPVAAALVGTGAALACFGWLDRPVSLGVVAFLPILLGIGSDFPLYLSRGGHDRAALVAAAAGVVGFASLGLSPLPFVSELGLALALGIVLTVLAALGLRWVLGVTPAPADRDPQEPRERQRRRAPVLVLAAAGAAAAVFGWTLLPGLSVESQPDALAEGLPQLTDAEYAEEVLGSNGEISIVVTGDDVATPEALAWSRDTQNAIVSELGDQMHPVLSLADLFRFLGEEPTPAEVDAAMEVMPRYLSSAVVRSDRAVGVMVYGVEFDDIAELGDLVERIEATAGDPPDGLETDVVGLPVAAVQGLELVSDGRLLINLVGISLAVAVVAIGLADVRRGARAALVVLMSTGWVALIAHLTTGSLSPLTVAIGSLVTATGCEFAVMVDGRRGRSAAVPVLTAAAAATAGYLVLALSDLAVLRDFGLLLAGGVISSVLAAFLVDALFSSTRPRPDPLEAAVPDMRELEEAPR